MEWRRLWQCLLLKIEENNITKKFHTKSESLRLCVLPDTMDFVVVGEFQSFRVFKKNDGCCWMLLLL
jgi:hypothetical protein